MTFTDDQIARCRALAEGEAKIEGHAWSITEDGLALRDEDGAATSIGLSLAFAGTATWRVAGPSVSNGHCSTPAHAMQIIACIMRGDVS